MKVKRDSAGVLAARGSRQAISTPADNRECAPLTLIPVFSGSCLFTSKLSTVHRLCIVLASGLRDSVRHVEAVKSDSGRRRTGEPMIMRQSNAGQLAKSRVVASLSGYQGNTPMEKRLLVVFHPGGRPSLGVPLVGSRTWGTCRRTPRVSRKSIAILHFRCSERRLQASSRTLEPIDGQRES